MGARQTNVDPWEPNIEEVAHMKFDFAVTKAMTAKLKQWVSGNNEI